MQPSKPQESVNHQQLVSKRTVLQAKTSSGGQGVQLQTLSTEGQISADLKAKPIEFSDQDTPLLPQKQESDFYLMKQLPNADQEEMKEMNSQEKQAYLQSLLSQGFTNGSDILASSGRHRMTQRFNK